MLPRINPNQVMVTSSMLSNGFVYLTLASSPVRLFNLSTAMRRTGNTFKNFALILFRFESRQKHSCCVVKVAVKVPCFLVRVIVTEFRWYDGTIAQKRTRTMTVVRLYGFTLMFCYSDGCCMEDSIIKQYHCTSHAMTIYNTVSIQLIHRIKDGGIDGFGRNRKAVRFLINVC